MLERAEFRFNPVREKERRLYYALFSKLSGRGRWDRSMELGSRFSITKIVMLPLLRDLLNSLFPNTGVGVAYRTTNLKAKVEEPSI
jgi:hypothetical protein